MGERWLFFLRLVSVAEKVPALPRGWNWPETSAKIIFNPERYFTDTLSVQSLLCWMHFRFKTRKSQISKKNLLGSSKARKAIAHAREVQWMKVRIHCKERQCHSLLLLWQENNVSIFSKHQYLQHLAPDDFLRIHKLFTTRIWHRNCKLTINIVLPHYYWPAAEESPEWFAKVGGTTAK